MASGSDEQTSASATEEERAGSEREEQQHESTGEHGAARSDGERQQAQSEGDEQQAQSGDEQQTQSEADGDDQQRSGSGGASVAKAIDDVSSLPGETVNDQDGRKVGQVKEIYAVGEDGTPMWVTIESSTGLGRTRLVFVPLARIKRQKDEIRVPYSFDHLHDSPEVEPGDEISEEDDHALRVYYAIGLADQELVENAQSYASQVPEDEGAAKKIDASEAEGPVREIDDAPPSKRAAEAYEKQQEEQGEDEHRHGRKATADEIFEEDGADSSGDGDEQDNDDGAEAKRQDDDAKAEAGNKDDEEDGKETGEDG